MINWYLINGAKQLRILITGSSGFLGGRISKFLKENKFNITLLNRKKNFPINEAVEPNVIKTKEKPSVKKIVLKIIKFLFLSFILSIDVPEI